MLFGYCGEFRASPCSLRSRPPSLCEGGVGGHSHPGPLPLRERGNGIQPDLSSRLSRSVLQLGALSLKLICEKIGVVSYRVFDSAE